jgi:hypothetical protein
MKRALSALAVLCLLALGPPDARAAQSVECSKHGGKTLAAGSQVRVFHSSWNLYACRFGSRRLMKLIEATEDQVEPPERIVARVNGRFVSWHDHACWKDCYQSAVYTADTVTFTRRLVADIGYETSVTEMVLSPVGGVAWIDRSAAGWRVQRYTRRRGLVVLDGAAPPVELKSLHRARGSVSWLNGEETRAAAFR